LKRYFSGADEIHGRWVRNVTFDADTQHDMKSVSKSIASLALRIAIDRGIIGSVNEPIFKFFPELSELRSPEKEGIQRLHILTMSIGLNWVEATPSNEGDNDEERMHMAPDPCRYVLGLAPTAPPGQEFFYNTGALTLLSAIIRKTTEFARDDVRAYGHYRL
jgi:CubicO group peptidase (beta-lactamase class C family)